VVVAVRLTAFICRLLRHPPTKASPHVRKGREIWFIGMENLGSQTDYNDGGTFCQKKKKDKAAYTGPLNGWLPGSEPAQTYIHHVLDPTLDQPHILRHFILR
jgi:hypothetical protein